MPTLDSRTFILTLILLSVRVAAKADDPVPLGNPAGASPATPGIFDAHPNLDYPNTPDLLFAHEAQVGGNAEVAAARLASRQSTNAAVKDFANQMINDHTKANQQLAAALSARSVPTSAAPDPDHKVMLDQLAKSEGKSFDVLYIRGQIIDHQKSAQLYEWIIDSGADPMITRYAMQTLPIVLHHLEMARNLQAQLTGSAP